MEDPTRTSGNQRYIAGTLQRRAFDRMGAGRADCGQFAAKSDGAYDVGSIHPSSHHAQFPAARTPVQFDPTHGLLGTIFRNWPIPGNAHGVAFNDPFTQNAAGYSWHYGRLEADHSVMMTDANRAAEKGLGGMLATFDLNMKVFAQAGKQPINHVPNIGGFVDYCHRLYGDRGLFYFVYFG